MALKKLFIKGIEKFKWAHPISEYTCHEKAVDEGCLHWGRLDYTVQ